VPERFVDTDYIDLEAIAAISRFRSAAGHSYTDGAETCRSMKHYFRPKEDVDSAAIRISAPVTGTVVTTRAEAMGLQLAIRPDAQPAYRFIIFHLRPARELAEGTRVMAGETLGRHIGPETWSDVAVGVDTPSGYRLVSWFDVITERLLDGYRARGLASRSAAIISRAERDADPLACAAGERFLSAGHLSDWVTLR
jgi:hypothetical protein